MSALTPVLQATQILDLDHTEQSDLDEMLDQWDRKKPRNKLRNAYYDGKHAARDLGGNLTPPHLQKLSLVLGWSAKAVDQLNRRCKLEGFTGGPADLPIDTIYQTNRLGSEAGQSDISSLLHGVAFLVTTIGDESAGEPPVLITGRSALEGSGLWDTRMRKLRAFVSINAVDSNGNPSSMTYYRRNVIITLEKAQLGSWYVERKAHPYGVPVEPLVYQPRLGRPFGASRISRAVMSIHNGALRTVLRSEVTAEMYQVPQRVLLGASEESFTDSNGDPRSMWQSVLGLIWAVPDDPDAEAGAQRADIKQLPGMSQDPYLSQLRMQAGLFSGETSIPITSLGIGGDANPTSADAYMASREDLIAEAEGTTDDWSPAWNGSLMTALMMLEGVTSIPEDWLTISPQWRSPVFTSRAQAADAGAKQIATVPWLADTTVGLELLGLTPDQLKRAMAERDVAQALAAARARLNRPSFSLQSPQAPSAPVASPDQDVAPSPPVS